MQQSLKDIENKLNEIEDSLSNTSFMPEAENFHPCQRQSENAYSSAV